MSMQITLHNGHPVSGEKLKMLCRVWERQHDLPSGAFEDWINSGSDTAALAIQNFSNFELVVVEEVAA
jgi:hypothetical protein